MNKHLRYSRKIRRRKLYLKTLYERMERLPKLIVTYDSFRQISTLSEEQLEELKKTYEIDMIYKDGKKIFPPEKIIAKKNIPE
jgi:hypothetical protein